MIQLSGSEVLDVFNKGRWLLLAANEKSLSIGSGGFIEVYGMRAKVDEVILGHREERLALVITYMDHHHAPFHSVASRNAQPDLRRDLELVAEAGVSEASRLALAASDQDG